MTTVDVPPRDTSASARADEFTALKAARLVAGLTAEDWHLLDPADDTFALMARVHPEACSTNADYPGWTPGRAA